MEEKILPAPVVIIQSRIDSLMEALVNTSLGFGLAVVTNIIVLPLMLGIEVSTGDSMIIALIFTGISIARSYILRRIFNGLSVWEAIRSFGPQLLNLSFWAWLGTRSLDRSKMHAKRNTPCYIESPHK